MWKIFTERKIRGAIMIWYGDKSPFLSQELGGNTQDSLYTNDFSFFFNQDKD